MDSRRLKVSRAVASESSGFPPLPSRRGQLKPSNKPSPPYGYGNRSFFPKIVRGTVASSSIAVIVDTVTTAIVNVHERRRRERKLVITNYRFPSLFGSAVIALKINGGGLRNVRGCRVRDALRWRIVPPSVRRPNCRPEWKGEGELEGPHVTARVHLSLITLVVDRNFWIAEQNNGGRKKSSKGSAVIPERTGIDYYYNFFGFLALSACMCENMII